jgi:hypothetical protein
MEWGILLGLAVIALAMAYTVACAGKDAVNRTVKPRTFIRCGRPLSRVEYRLPDRATWEYFTPQNDLMGGTRRCGARFCLASVFSRCSW